jgi:hypothetical protein
LSVVAGRVFVTCSTGATAAIWTAGLSVALGNTLVALAERVAPEAKAAVCAACTAASVRSAFFAAAVGNALATFALEIIVAGFTFVALSACITASVVAAEFTGAIGNAFAVAA